jgi:hypothetical protein
MKTAGVIALATAAGTLRGAPAFAQKTEVADPRR